MTLFEILIYLLLVGLCGVIFGLCLGDLKEEWKEFKEDSDNHNDNLA
jgi:hypothetical protein